MSNILIFGLLFIVVIIGAVIIYKQIQLQKQNKQYEAIKKANKKRIKYGCGIGSVLGGSLGLFEDAGNLSDLGFNPEGYSIGKYIINDIINDPFNNGTFAYGVLGCPIGAAIGAGINVIKR